MATSLQSAGDGFWGLWRSIVTCPPRTLATGLKMRIAPPAGTFGDDKGATGLMIRCRAWDATSVDVKVWDGQNDGEWTGWAEV